MIGLDIAKDTYQDSNERENFLNLLKKQGFVENYLLIPKTKDGRLRFVTVGSHFYLNSVCLRTTNGLIME